MTSELAWGSFYRVGGKPLPQTQPVRVHGPITQRSCYRARRVQLHMYLSVPVLYTCVK